MTAQEKWLADAKRRESDLAAIVSRFYPAGVDRFHEGLQTDNVVLAGDILQKTWENAPDKPWIHEIPGWQRLCDLCSDYVFGEVVEPEPPEHN